MWYLKDYYWASVINNWDITLAQIRSDKRLRFSNYINYQQAYRVKKALLEEIKGQEADCFAQFPAYMTRLVKANKENRSQIMWDKETRAFKAAAFAPQATIKAHAYLRQFWAINACHTKS
jgi:hypothetical protein